MKNKLTLLILLFIICNSSYSQTDCVTDDNSSPCCNGLISTDPRNGNAVNNEKPSEYKNSFNWMTNKIWVYHPDGDYDDGIGVPIQIDNPFFTDDNYLKHINFSTFQLGHYDASKLDIYPENGWELIHRNNGFELDNQTILINPVASEDRAGPYFILYNKYTGTLRILGSFNGFGANDKMLTTLSFRLANNMKTTALLNQYGDVSQTLDQPTAVTNVSQGSQGAAPTAGNSWFAVDFKMAYDPCGCMNNSELNIEFSTFNEADVQLGGRLIATSVPLDASGDSPLLNGQDFLTAVTREGFDVKGGMLTYNNIGSLVNAYKSSYNLSDFEELALKALGSVLSSGLSSGLDPIINGVINNFVDGLIPNDKLMDLTGKDTLKVGLKVGAETSKLLMSAITPDKPKVPNIHFIEGEMLLRGTYKNSTPLGIGNINLVTPGSPNSLYSSLPWYNYPFYNEPLGLFAVLEKPKIRRYWKTTKNDYQDCHYYGPYVGTICIPRPGVRTFYYNLSQPIKFYFNPAAEVDLSKTRIYAGYIVKYKEMDAGGLWANVKKEYISDFYPINNIDDILLPINFSTFDNFGVTETSIKIRFMIDYTFKSNRYGKINRSFQILTYNVDLSNVSESDLSSKINTANFPKPYEVINDITYTENTTITALDKIVIKGNVNTSSNDVKVTFIAGNEVEIENASVLKPNIQIKTGNINGFNFDYSINPQSSGQVKDFCTTSYKGNTTSASLKSTKVGVEENFTEIKQERILENLIKVYPNPTKDMLNIQFLFQENITASIEMIGLMGQKLFKREISEISNQSLQIDLSSFNKGVYFLLIQTKNSQFKRKIVIQ